MSFPRLSRVFPLLLLITLGTATVIPRSEPYDVFGVHARQEELPANTPSCIPSCDLNTCGGGVCGVGSNLVRRSSSLEELIDSFSQLNVSSADQYSPLEKRVFSYAANSNNYDGGRQPTNAESNAYLPAVFNGGENSYYGTPRYLVSNGDERAVSQQVQYGNNAFQIMSGGLHGCTVVAIVSRRAVWMAHFWESYSHGSPNLDSPTNEPAFVDRVISFIQGNPVTRPAPSTYKPYIAPTGPSVDGSLFNQDDDDTRVYIMTPVSDGQQAGSQKIKYTNRIGAIETAIRRQLGVRKKPQTVRFTYLRLNYNEEADRNLENQSARGMCLFQYDPNSDGNGQRAWRLWMENSFVQLQL